jgi:hypothetical protein
VLELQPTSRKKEQRRVIDMDELAVPTMASEAWRKQEAGLFVQVDLTSCMPNQVSGMAVVRLLTRPSEAGATVGGDGVHDSDDSATSLLSPLVPFSIPARGKVSVLVGPLHSLRPGTIAKLAGITLIQGNFLHQYGIKQAGTDGGGGLAKYDIQVFPSPPRQDLLDAASGAAFKHLESGSKQRQLPVLVYGSSWVRGLAR